MTTDPVADMLTRIRNALMARHEYVDIPYSTMKFSISKILKEEGYIKNYKVFVDDKRKRFLKIYLNYDEDSRSVINGLKRISRPGRRIYVGVDDIQKLKKNIGLIILSTSKGLLTDMDAKKKRTGGEPLLMVW